jgi:hypothetical protein
VVEFPHWGELDVNVVMLLKVEDREETRGDRPNDERDDRNHDKELDQSESTLTGPSTTSTQLRR